MVIKQTFISCYFFVSQPSLEMEIFAFCAITFEPIKIQTRSAPQNDRLNFSFVKDAHVDGGNLASNSCKTAICQSTSFRETLYFYFWSFWAHSPSLVLKKKLLKVSKILKPGWIGNKLFSFFYQFQVEMFLKLHVKNT